MMNTNTLKPEIYVACLSCYNACRPYGKWIDANQDPDELGEAILAMLDSCPGHGHEEFAFHDYQDLPDLYLGHYPSLAKVSEVAALVVEYQEAALAAFSLFDEQEDIRELLAHHHPGPQNQLEGYAAEYVETAQDLDDFVLRYFDDQALARDMEVGSDLNTVEWNGQIHIFQNF